MGLKPHTIFQIPIVDLQSVILNKSSEDIRSTIADLKEALECIGFVYLVNHGISKETIRKAFEESDKFFTLSENIKMDYERDYKETFHGYTPCGRNVKNPQTTNIVKEMRESFDCNIHTFNDTCPYPDNMVPDFRPAMTDLMNQCRGLGVKVLEMLEIALDLNSPGALLQTHKSLSDPDIPTYTGLRTLNYPKLPETIVPGTVRFDEHTDYGTVTLLFQDDIGGLEVKNVEGQWIQATPIPNSILVNVGDLLNVWSGGQFPSTVHRVLVPKEELKRKTRRQSVAFFIKPDNDARVAPIRSDAETPEFSNLLTAGDHFRQRTYATRLNYSEAKAR